jgi:NarL family two-component system sensor histidine kinase LiaS
MLQRLRQRFGTIRWKLTGTFVLVSLLLALTLITILVGAVLWIVNSNLILQALGDVATQEAKLLVPEFESADRSPQRLGVQLRAITADLDRESRPQARGITGQLSGATPTTTPGDLQFNSQIVVAALLDSDGRVITTTMPTIYRSGALLADLEPPATRAIVVAATHGITDTARLAAWNDPAHEPLVAAPIVSRDGRVLGAVYLRFSGLPSTEIILTRLPPVLVTIIVPWLAISGAIGVLYAWIASRGFSRRLKRLTEASAAIAGGDLARRVEDRSADEIGQLARQFNAMADQLAENMRALRLLVDQNAQLAERATQLATVEERNRLARDLHDSVSQELFSLTMLAAAARRVVERDPAVVVAQLEEIETMARQALHETRGLIFALRPAMLDGRGLVPALHDLAAAARERQGLAVDLSISGEHSLPLEQEQALFRIIQEALANVARHSGARAARVALYYEEAQTRLTISDQGRGFDPAAPRNTRAIGLDSMAERAAALGGTLAIESAPGQGTTIRVMLPAAV